MPGQVVMSIVTAITSDSIYQGDPILFLVTGEKSSEKNLAKKEVNKKARVAI